MNKNVIRELIKTDSQCVSTRLWSPMPLFAEAIGVTGMYNYVEFVAEYAPFDQRDMEMFAMACELHDMGSMIKVDFQDRMYVAQKAVGSGFQAINFADHHTPEEVEETIHWLKPDMLGEGRFGKPTRRFIKGDFMTPLEHAEHLRNVVLCFMIEKQEAVENIEAICSIPGVDMVQFGPTDFSMSMGKNREDNKEAIKAAEKKVIETALRHGVIPRCEINSAEDAEYYKSLGVKHFSLGDQMLVLRNFWKNEGTKLHSIIKE